MSTQRTLRVDYDKTTSVLCVVGSELNVNLDRSSPPNSKFFSVKCSPNVQYSIDPLTVKPSCIPLSGNTILKIKMCSASEFENDGQLSIQYYGVKKDKLGEALLQLTAVEISLDVDADRDGVVEKNNPNKGSWKWGPDGYGAIVLVNCDCERTDRKKLDWQQDFISILSDLKDMSLMVLRTKGPAKLPEGYKLAMHFSQEDAESVRVYRTRSSEEVKIRLAGKKSSDIVGDYPRILNDRFLVAEIPYPGEDKEMKFYVEGLRFPDKDFDGFVSIKISVMEPQLEGLPETPIFTDKVLFRMAPWIMTPNTQEPEEVFVCGEDDNKKFLEAMKTLVINGGYKLKVYKQYFNKGDRWMQDELEFGYIDSPHQKFPVVLDSPRNRQLNDFPFFELLGPDFGYVTKDVKRRDVNSLDSFGNLDVSPPVTVNGRSYPLGRIFIGGAFPTATEGRNMTEVVQDFLWAQKVQEPIALFTDWLEVGHVDEFMSFVPANDKKGFRLLLASPDAGYKLFRRLQNDGHGKAKLFEGLSDVKTVTVDELLKNEQLQKVNNYVQSCIDWNRDVLKRELGLDDEDIINLPILFEQYEYEDKKSTRVVAYYPDMVNMIVLGKNLGIPKPFGPKVNGKCAIEAETSALLMNLGLSCTFIDDFVSYHIQLGEVHCGSNVRRKPFDFKWWNLEM